MRGPRLIWIVPQHIIIVVRSFSSGDLHAARDPAQNGRPPVLGEIVPGPNSHMREDAPEQFLADTAHAFFRKAIALLAHQFGQALSQFAQGQNEIPNPVAIALRGIDGNSASLGSCTRMMPPDSLTALTPTAPSEPAPVRITAQPSPVCSASERKNKSIGARFPRGSSNSAVAISSLVMCNRRSGGMT